MPNFTVCTSWFSPSPTHGLCAIFASNSRFMRLFPAPLDTCLDSPLLCQPLSSKFALRCLCAFKFLGSTASSDLFQRLTLGILNQADHRREFTQTLLPARSSNARNFLLICRLLIVCCFLVIVCSFWGKLFLLTVGAFLLAVQLLRLQSLKALARRTFPL